MGSDVLFSRFFVSFVLFVFFVVKDLKLMAMREGGNPANPALDWIPA